MSDTIKYVNNVSEKNNVFINFYGKNGSQLEYFVKSNGITNESTLTIEDNKGNVKYQNINEEPVKYTTTETLNQSVTPDSLINYALQKLHSNNNVGAEEFLTPLNKLQIHSNDLTKFINLKENFLQQISEVEKKIDLSEFSIKDFLNELESIEHEIKNDLHLPKMWAINPSTGIIINKNNSYSIVENTNLIGNNTIEGNSYISNAKIENASISNGVVIDSYIQGSQLNNSIVNGVCLFNSISSNSILGNGNKVLLAEDKHYNNSMAFKGQDGKNYKKDIDTKQASELVEKIYNEGKKASWGNKFIKTFMIGALAVAGMVGVAHADNSVMFTPHTESSQIVTYANSAGYNLNKLDKEQKQFMNIDQVVQRNDNGIVTSVENHSNKILPGIGYLTEDNSPDQDYVKISTTNEGKTYTITTNFKQVTVKADSSILAYNGDIPYLVSTDAMNQEIQKQKEMNQQKLASKNSDVERS